MKANELRIGNIVEHDGLVLSVLGVSESDVEIQRPGGYASEWVDLDDCEPIPLTEEWLKSLGANQCTPANDHQNKYTYGRFVLLWRSKYQYWNVNDLESFGHISKVEFVHEWQNLVYVLNGEELEKTQR